MEKQQDKYYFFYYRERGEILHAKGVEQDGIMVGGEPRILNDLKWEITETEFKYASFGTLRRKHPFV